VYLLKSAIKIPEYQAEPIGYNKTTMKIDILTIFPQMFGAYPDKPNGFIGGPFAESMVKRAQDEKIVEITIHDLRAWSTDKHRSVDDTPYGGGAGMIMRVDIIDRAVTSLKSKINPPAGGQKSKIVLLDTKGELYNQRHAQKLAKSKHLILIAGHYEGIDHRVHDHIADEVFSIGPYVLTGGELPAMVIVDSVVRLLPGVLGNPESLQEESYSSKRFKPTSRRANSYLEYPQYTRPETFRGWKVPKILLSGNHKEINQWRQKKSKRVAF
jgi:tRNA (guanine37-N1)-methyltransferase